MLLQLEITNADENLLKALKSVIKLYPNSKLKVKKEKLTVNGFTPKLKASLETPKYYTLETSPAIKKIDEKLEKNPQLKEQLEKELDEELKSYENRSHS